MTNKGLLIVISGPSGAGKGTICDQVRKQMPYLRYSVSATTREPRVGEKDGVNYYFITKQKFQEMIDNDELLEWAKVYDNFYGTPYNKIEEELEKGCDVILEIDIQGALQVKKKISQAVFIFVLPPSLEELSSRIINRGTESGEVLQKRINSARTEISYADKYDYLIINDNLDKAADNLKAIIKAEKCKVFRNMEILNQIN